MYHTIHLFKVFNSGVFVDSQSNVTITPKDTLYR